MTDAQFQTFMTGGIFILIVAALTIAWLLWAQHEGRERALKAALEGTGYEFRINLKRIIAEVSSLAHGEPARPSAILPLRHPQLDGLNANLLDVDRKAISVVTSTYQVLEATKNELRAALELGDDMDLPLQDGINAAIDGIASLYLWECHDGCAPAEASATRTWTVRDWMKGHGFPADAFPGLHLRDAVVERLRLYGMTLTPKPLSHTAHEYWSMRYDRYKDPNAPFWKRSAQEMERANPSLDLDEPPETQLLDAPTRAAASG